MAGVRKKPFFLSLFIFFLVASVVIPLSFSFFSGFFFQQYSKKLLGQKLNFESIIFEDGSFKIKKICAVNDHCDISIDEIDIEFKLVLSSLQFRKNISVINPKINIKKIDNNFFTSFKKKKNSKISSSIAISKGLVCIKDTKIDFSYFNDGVGSTKCSFNFLDKKDEKVQLSFTSQNKENQILCKIEDISAEMLFSTFQKLNLALPLKIDDVEGVITGDINLQIKDKKPVFYSANIDLFNLGFTELISNKKIRAEKINLTIASLKNKRFCFLTEKFINNYKIKSEIKNGSIGLSDGDFLQKINGFCFYDPTIGSRVSISALSHLNELKPIFFESRGYFNSSFCNWIDFSLSFFEQQKSSGMFVKVYEKSKKELLVDAKLKDFDADYVNLVKKVCINLNKNVDAISLNSVLLNSDIEIEIGKDNIGQVAFKNFNLEKLAINHKNKRNVEIFSDGIQGDFSWNHKDPLVSFSSNLKLNKTSAAYEDGFLKKKVHEIYGNFCVEKGFIKNSRLKFNLEDLKGYIDFKDSISSLQAVSQIKGGTRLLFGHNFQDYFSSNITLKKNKKEIEVKAEAQIKNVDDSIENISLNMGLCDFKLDKKSISHLSIHANNIILDKFCFLLPLNEMIRGRANLFLSYKYGLYTAKLEALNLAYENQYYKTQLPSVGDFQDSDFTKESFLFATFDEHKKTWHLDCPELEGTFHLKKYDLDFFCKRARVKTNQNFIEFILPETISEKVSLGGSVYLDFSHKNCVKLDILTNRVEASIQDLTALFSHFRKDINLEGVSGSFKGEKESFYFSKTLGSSSKETMGIKGLFTIDEYLLYNGAKLQKGSFLLDWQSDADILEIIDMKAQCFAYGQAFCLSSPLLMKKADKMVFDVRLEKESFQCLRLVGTSHFLKDEIKLFFDSKKTHFFNSPLEINSLDLGYDYKLKNIDIVSSLDLALFSIFIPKEIKGFLKTKVFMEEGRLTIISALDNFSINTRVFPKIDIQATQKRDSSFTLKSSLADTADLSFSLQKKGLDFKIDDLFFKKNNSYIKAQGAFFKSLNKLDLKIEDFKVQNDDFTFFFNPMPSLDFQLNGKGWITYLFNKNSLEADLDVLSSKAFYGNLMVETLSDVNLHFSNLKGVHISSLDLIFLPKERASFKSKFKFISYDMNQKKWIFQNSQLHLPKDFLSTLEEDFPLSNMNLFTLFKNFFNFDKDLNLSANFEYFADKKIFKAEAQKASIYINEEQRNLRDITVCLDKNTCHCELDMMYIDSYHKLFFDFDLLSSLGKLTLGKEKDPLTFLFLCEKENLLIKRIRGSYLGLFADFSLKNNDQYTDLFGKADINFQKMAAIFPKELRPKIEKIGKGYQLKGNILISKDQMVNFVGFKGSFGGRQFEAFDYTFKTMLADISISPKSVHISNLKISDLAFSLFVENIDLEKVKSNFIFCIPHIKLLEFRPSLLQEKNKEAKIKPLLIRSLEVNELKGDLKDLETITGKGEFNFVNSFKRGHSLFELPADFLGRILGLDLELLIPVRGDVFFEIKDKKCMITKIDDVYSENKRSQFFLVDTPYVDFDGNININIKMKQYVLFKITEKFILSLKGNVDKPDFSMKKNKFFSLSQ